MSIRNTESGVIKSFLHHFLLFLVEQRRVGTRKCDFSYPHGKNLFILKRNQFLFVAFTFVEIINQQIPLF
ncbi:hypothetical protein THIOM_002805 [Candidatus Thiomargarita nelsonii]|uniref:Uncharacterized protein n=1 Tax=Candidatus Thiomargarita nelsonii TaxID=1003181 RepID=A0A176S0I8_9GAMM|nr:hypothetical protein THIOM_002805 [Candidatus Thiomargarita nelsonii]